ncbi:MAG TPA: hypothetical protein VJH75_01360 [Patescibacteria group bacterium]|nr:hypothetical protein [Patescibacteria group bacterium]
MTELADGEEAAVLVPVVVEPVEVEVAPGAVPVEVGHVAVAVRVDPGRAVKIYKISSAPLPFEYSRGCILVGNFFH